MNDREAAPRPTPEECERLTGLLAGEDRENRRLLRLAVRQNRYMRRQDVPRLEFNAREWGRYLPAAREARTRRERFLLEIGGRLGIPRDELRMTRLSRRAEGRAGEELRRVLGAWERTATELVRQNSLNGVLARFCLDLVAGESAVFRRGVAGQDPCYDDRGHRPAGGMANVLERQA
ncbi:MAG: flagellar export chaperone FlgN [bacterium]|nr:flagellar export chaperone FlgN [bacterium]